MNNKRTIIIYAKDIGRAREKLKEVIKNCDSVIKRQSNNMISFVNGDSYYLFAEGYNVKAIRADYIYVDKFINIECLLYQIYPLIRPSENSDIELF